MEIMSTNRRQDFDAVKLTLGALLREGKYVIPPYQRPYRWGVSQVGLLLRDLLDFFRIAKPDETYSLGTIVCDKKDNTYEILDGQQRLTTIDLILRKIEENIKKLSKETFKSLSHPQLIAAYRYLPNKETADHTGLPRAKAQQDEISRQLKDGERSSFSLSQLSSLHEFVLDRVVVQRVVIPLSGRVAYEPQQMFEIVNIRGQKLTELDIVKSRLLSTLDNEPAHSRALFDYVWTHAEDNLLTQETKAFIPDAKTLANLRDPEIKVLQRSIGDILSESLDDVPVQDDAPAKDQLQQTDTPEDRRSSNLQPAVDLANAFVIAHELFKYWNKNEKAEALTEQRLQDRVDHFIRDQKEDLNQVTRNTWRLLGILRVVLQTVAYWGPYRDVENETVSFGRNERIGRAALTFMAANGYQHFGQYWLLLLCAVALKNVAPDLNALPVDAESYTKFPTPTFSSIEKEAYRGLLYLGYYAAKNSFSGASAAIFTYLDKPEIDREEAFEALCKDSVSWPEYWYFRRGFSRWDLYWIEYLLSLDAKQDFKILKKISRDETLDSALKPGLDSFEWGTFESKKNVLRMVAWSDVEHWLAQDKAKDDDDLHRRHGFGNLALIDKPTNSTLGKQGVTDKANEIKDKANPSWKLWWLAVFSSRFGSESFQSELVAPLSHFWGLYLSEFFADPLSH